MYKGKGINQIIGNHSNFASYYDDLHFSIEYVRKMFGINKNDIRKEKIKKLFNDETRKI